MKTVTAFCLTASTLSSSPSAFADDEAPPETSTPPPPHRTANNSGFIELLGNGGVPDLTFPVLANYYVGKGSHKLQVGAGALFWYRSISLSSGQQEHLEAAATLVLGYRYLPPHGGFDFGAGLAPMIGDGF